MQQIRLFLIAVQFFTRIPIPGWVGFQPEWLSQASRWFPAVGTVVGALSALVFVGAAAWLPVKVAVLLAMAAGIVITGSFHEDGLADSADALGGHAPKAQALTIMKDSRIGTYGAVALLMAVLLRAETLASFTTETIGLLLIAGHTVSRGWSVLPIAFMTYVRDDDSARAKPIADSIDGAGRVIALITVLAVLAAVGAIAPAMIGALLAGTLAGGVIALWWFRVLRRRLGGYTGDTLGATQQLSETAFYLGVLAAL